MFAEFESLVGALQLGAVSSEGDNHDGHDHGGHDDHESHDHSSHVAKRSTHTHQSPVRQVHLSNHRQPSLSRLASDSELRCICVVVHAS